MIEIIKNQINTMKMYVFLCGSYFDKKNKKDKRLILKNDIKKYDNLYPAIIDESFNLDNFSDDTLNIRFMEEIIASIAQSTFIILESFSSAAELGLFGSSGKNNEIFVIKPYYKDIENNKIGYFIEYGFKKTDNDSVAQVNYRPSIKRVALTSNMIDEHYYFTMDKTPAVILEIIKKINKKNKSIFDLLIVKKNVFLENDIAYNEIFYYEIDRTVYIKISMYLLFNILVKKVLSYNLKTVNILDKIDELTESTIETVKRTILRFDKSIRCSDILTLEFQVVSEISSNMDLVVKHIVHIVKSLLEDNNLDRYNRFKNIEILEDIDDSEILCDVYDTLDILEEDLILPGRTSVVNRTIKTGAKNREISMYSEAEEGKKLKLLHNKLNSSIMKTFTYSPSSYAYQKGKGIKDYIVKHINSKNFIKLDVKNFFNSIDKSILAEIIKDMMKKNGIYPRGVIEILESLFIKNKDCYSIPLGFTISPLISEIYMSNFDKTISSFSKNNNLIYTRYADDITISSKFKIKSQDIIEIISRELNLLKLKINSNKLKVVSFNSKGDSIKLLGVNIIYTRASKNKISVGNKYIREVAKEICEYSSLNYDNFDYNVKRILGEVNFIRFINNSDYDKLINAVKRIGKERAEGLIEKYKLGSLT